jgi:dephospho-CoA kinase
MVISDIPLVVVMCVIVLLTTRLADKGSRLTFLRYDVQQRKKMLMLRDTGDERKASQKIAKVRPEKEKW